ncbi:MAG TPA: DUF4367 domain-containing protein [Candidatus Scatomonas pullistercoris]|uniref:DUF4367 domain-containing protein n=1 Tax=Candidatus Scatomonas pullistercoris TaxID=2840920 RepID=A0A9D1P502_9FIRM|nr:DUF4367 domain-containing protein [Candidatus Scatomonas pullistercoris]
MREEKEKKWKQQLLKALDAEAEKIEQRAGPCQPPLSEEKKEEMYQNIMARIRQSEETAGGSGEAPERRAAASGRRGVMRKPFWKHPLRLAGVLLAVTAAVFGTSLISEANRAYWIGKWEALTGDGKVEQSDNGTDYMLTETSEMELRERAEEELGIIVPEFFYLPDDTKFVDGTMYLQRGRVILRYSLGQQYLYLTIDKTDKSLAGSTFNSHQVLETIEVGTGEEPIEVVISEDSTGEITVRQGEWTYHNCQYVFGGAVTAEEIKEVLINMHFMN